MPPKRPAKSTGWQYCNHCGKTVSRWTAARHQKGLETQAALDAALNLPPEPLPEPNPQIEPSPPISPPLGDISLTSTERALSPINANDLDDDDLAILGVGFQFPTVSAETPDDEEILELSMQYEDLDLEPEEEGIQQGDEEAGEVHPGIHDLDQERDGGGTDDDDGENDNFGGAEELQDYAAEEDGYGGLEMEVDSGLPFDDIFLGDGGTTVDVSCFWGGLPGGAEGNAVDDRDEDEGEPALIASAQLDDREGSVSSRPSTPSTTTSQPAELLAPPSPHPELVKIWDLKAARHRKFLVCLDNC